MHCDHLECIANWHQAPELIGLPRTQTLPLPDVDPILGCDPGDPIALDQNFSDRRIGFDLRAGLRAVRAIAW